MILFHVILINVLFYTVVFIIGKVKNKHSLIDVFWGLSFVNLVWWTTIITNNFTLQIIIVNILVTIWGVRLTIHLLLRNWNSEEDYRYTNIKNKLKTNLTSIPLFIKEYIYIYMMQAGFSLLISTALLIFIINNVTTNVTVFLIGVIISLFGLYFEILGDYQLKKYKKNNSGTILNTGLWKYSRHPNYFGEVTFWYGIYFMTFAALFSIFGIITPLTINFLIVKLSGIPLLERKMMKNDDYQKYAEVTSKFIPRRPRD